MKLRRLALAAMLVLTAPIAAHAAEPTQAQKDQWAKEWEDRLHTDWPWLAKYQEANAALPARSKEPRVVFMGDSITDAWQQPRFSFFPGKPYVDRGISGQTTPQMLIRFTRTWWT